LGISTQIKVKTQQLILWFYDQFCGKEGWFRVKMVNEVYWNELSKDFLNFSNHGFL
jgi:hypothetical protein